MPRRGFHSWTTLVVAKRRAIGRNTEAGTEILVRLPIGSWMIVS